MFGGSGKRKGFARIQISPTEKRLSWMLLLLIAGIGAAIYLKGQRDDPSLFSLDQSLLADMQTQTVRAQPDRLVYDEEEGEVPSGASARGAEGSSSGLLDGLPPEGWKPMGSAEQFTSETLYEKINGRAEQYLAYNVAGLTCVSLVDASDESRFIDIFVYDMGNPPQAFGIYSVERSEGQPAVDLGRGGYRAESSIFFWKGRYYAQVLASELGPERQQTAQEIARKLDARLQDTGEPVWGFTALPEKDRIPGTIQYFMKDALSLDFLKNTYTARYQKGDAEITAFLSKQPSPDAAERTFSGYEAYLKAYGRVVGSRQDGGAVQITGDMGGVFDIVFQKGHMVGGVTMAADQALAEQAAADLLKTLPE